MVRKNGEATDSPQRKYSVWNYYASMYRELWNYAPVSYLKISLEIITNVLKPLITAWLPAYLIGILENGCTAKDLVISCLTVYAGVILIYGGNALLSNKNGLYYMFLRLKHLMVKMLNKSTEMDYSQFEQDVTQNEMQKCKNALEGSAGPDGFYKNNTALLTGIAGLILYSILIARLHILVVLMLIGMSAVQYIACELAENYEEKHRDQQAGHNRYQEYLFNQSTDLKSGKDVRLYQLQKWLIPLYEKHNRDHQKQAAKNQSVYFLADFVGLLLVFFRDAVCYGYLLYLLIQGMGISEFVLYLGIVGGYGNWCTQIIDNFVQISRSLVGVYDYRSYVEKENNRRQGERELKKTETFDIVFEDVCFQYPGSDRLVLDHLSFHINSSEKIALVGLNGAGKTTLVKLLCGFYRPVRGRILINGIDMAELNMEKYMGQISVLFQDSVLLPYTIAQNISCQVDELTDKEKIWQVLKQSGLAEKIRELPQKENSFIGKDIDEDGVHLSGGQIQKLFLARALYKDSSMLILDEPTAALDALAESEMYEQYGRLVAGKTSIYISHRLSSTRFCDRIFFLENGRITESGSHLELMLENKGYAEMYRIQSQYYVEEEM